MASPNNYESISKPNHEERESRFTRSNDELTTSDSIAGSRSIDSAVSNDLDLETRPLLSPDDPKVSPLNLHKIQLLRIGVIILFAINLFLFSLFLISDFISIPGLDNRGKSFMEINLISINLISNLLTLWCFIIPSFYERLLGYISAFLIGFNFLIIFTVPYLKNQYGLVGNFILLWTFGNLIFSSLADYWVEQGKIYQEIRLTGRPETRRTLFEFFVIFVKTVIKLFVLVIILLISLTIWLNTFDSRIKPWGKMIPVNDDEFKVHLSCYGDVYNSSSSKQPILLLESGQLISDEYFANWVEELYHLNKIDRYCIWDRPGFGYSDSAPSPVSISIITDYLSQALRREQIEGPFSLIGYDIGGLYSRVFASKHPGQIHSLFLVDSWHEDLLLKNPFHGNRKNEKLPKYIIESMNTRTGFKLWSKGLISPWGLKLHLHWILHPKSHRSNDRIFGRDMYYQSKYIRARLQEQTTSSILSYNEVLGSDLKNIPMSVMSSDYMIRNSLNWGAWQRELTKLSGNVIEWTIADNSNHEIWDTPKARVQLQDALLRLVSEKSKYGVESVTN